MSTGKDPKISGKATVDSEEIFEKIEESEPCSDNSEGACVARKHRLQNSTDFKWQSAEPDETPMDGDEKGKRVFSWWMFRLTASKVPGEEHAVIALLTAWKPYGLTGYAFNVEQGKNGQRVKHIGGVLEFAHAKRKKFGWLENRFVQAFPLLVFDGRDYLNKSESTAANRYNTKSDTRIRGPFVFGAAMERAAKEQAEIESIDRYVVKIQLYSWQRWLVKNVLNQPTNDRDIWWLWEPFGNAGKTTFAKWLDQNYAGVMILGGKTADMKNGIVNYITATKKYPRIIIINCSKTFDMDYLSADGIEQIKDAFFFSGKYGDGKGASPMVNCQNPHVIIFANQEPPFIGDMALDRFNSVRLPDGKAKDLKPKVWDLTTYVDSDIEEEDVEIPKKFKSNLG